MDKDNENLQEPNEGRKTIFQITRKYLNKHYNIRYNEITNDVQYKKISHFEYEPLNIDKLYVELQDNGYKICIQKLASLLNSGITINYNPIKDYFEKSKYIDRDPNFDYINHLADFIETKNQVRFKNHFKKMFVRTVACALDDKIVNKQAFIFVHSKQNSGKTTFLNWLCPPELEAYTTENINTGTNNDNLIALGENFIINLDELAALGRSEINALKSMMSKAKIKVRHPYGKKTMLTSRKASLVGSTNKNTFLNDETGSVRWLCFDLERINWEYSNAVNINQVWAQAFELYNSGFKYQLTLEEIEENERENKRYLLQSFEMDFIQRNYIPGTKSDNDHFYAAADFLKAMHEKLGFSLNTTVEKIGKALTILGFERTEKYNGNYSVKGYYIKNISQNDLTQLLDED
jgi:predicted P-loop ATPase